MEHFLKAYKAAKSAWTINQGLQLALSQAVFALDDMKDKMVALKRSKNKSQAKLWDTDKAAFQRTYSDLTSLVDQVGDFTEKMQKQLAHSLPGRGG